MGGDESCSLDNSLCLLLCFCRSVYLVKVNKGVVILIWPLKIIIFNLFYLKSLNYTLQILRVILVN